MKTAIYPGSFDPVTLGHINIIKRAAVAFDKVIVCVMVNSEKNGGLFTPEERIDLMRKSIQVSNVEFDVNYGLVAEYAKAKGARVLVKGLRAVSDFEQEVQMAMINSKINPDLDTVFFPSSESTRISVPQWPRNWPGTMPTWTSFCPGKSLMTSKINWK